MAHPSKYYIKYLLAEGFHKDNDSISSVNKSLDVLGIPSVDADEFDDIKGGLSFPPNFSFRNKEHAATVKFMKAERIHDLWNPHNGDADVFRFMELKQPLETTKILILGRLDHEDIAQRVTTKHRLPKQLTGRMVQLVEHYFWNAEEVSEQEWTKLLYESCMSHTYLAAVRGGDKHALFKAGFDPEVGGKEVLRNAFTHAHFRLDATRHMPDCKDTADIIAKLSKELVNLYDAIFGEGEDLKKIMEDLHAFKMSHEDHEIPSIRELAGEGSFSGEGGKK